MPTYFMYCRKCSEAEKRQILPIDSEVTEPKRYTSKRGPLAEAKSAKAPASGRF